MKKNKRIIPVKPPTQARARALVDAIVTAAARVFGNRTYTEATTNRIAEVAGVSIGSLYQYFPNKDSLVGLLIDRRIAEQLDGLRLLLDNSKEKAPETILKEILRKIATDSLSNRGLLKTLYERGSVLELTPRVIEARTRACAMIESYLQRSRDPRLRKENLSTAVFCLLNGSLGIVAAAVFTEFPDDGHERLLRELDAWVDRNLFT